MSQAVYECWFLDVGQGSSNIILLGQGRAIVIDAGPKGACSPMKLLNQHVETIEALIISHNHEDHDGNVASLLAAYKKKIRNIFILQDNPSLNIWTLAVLQHYQDIDFPAPTRLEASGCRPSVLFSEGTTPDDSIEISVLYPDMLSNLQSQNMGTSGKNYTSAIIRMKCGNRKIVFGGDSTIESWENVAKRMPNLIPIQCDAMTVPHHGGNISLDDKANDAVQNRLFQELINPEYAIISVGTNNSYGHPIPGLVHALVNSGAKILCTQMTPQCCDNLEAIRQIPRTISQPSDSQPDVDVSQSGKSRRVACFGSIVAAVGKDKLVFSSHVFNNIDKLRQVRGFHPLCGN